MKPVIVVWSDAVHYPENGEDDVQRLCAIGFLYKKNKRFIKLLTLNNKDHSPAFVIPKGCVIEIIPLEVPNKYLYDIDDSII